jgi:hypothetical protein
MDEDAELQAILEESRREYEEKEKLRVLIEKIERKEAEHKRQEEIRLEREEAVRRVREEEIKRLREEEIQRIKDEEEAKRRIEEERNQRARDDEIRRVREIQEEQLKRKSEAEEKRLKELQQLGLDERLRAEQNENRSAEDDELQAAIQASLSSHGQEKTRHDFNQRTHQLLNSLDPPLPGRFRQCIEVPKDTGQLVVGLHHHHTKEIARRAGGNCKIRFLPRNISINFDGQMGDCLLIEADSAESVETAETGLLVRVADLFFQDTNPATLVPSHSLNSTSSVDTVEQERCLKKSRSGQREMHGTAEAPSSLRPQRKVSTAPQRFDSVDTGSAARSPLRPERWRHIIVDSSNIFIGARTCAQAADPSLTLDANELANLLIRNPEIRGTRVIAGSVPSARNPAWQHWEQAGFRIKICNFEGAEDMVDEFLHAQAMNIVMERQGDQSGENTLVLCTGDGNDNHGFSNFVNVARNTARMGWRVEIWSWKHCNSQNFVSLVQEYRSCMRLYHLDTFASRILSRYSSSHSPLPLLSDYSSTGLKEGKVYPNRPSQRKLKRTLLLRNQRGNHFRHLSPMLHPQPNNQDPSLLLLFRSVHLSWLRHTDSDLPIQSINLPI